MHELDIRHGRLPVRAGGVFRMAGVLVMAFVGAPMGLSDFVQFMAICGSACLALWLVGRVIR